MKQDAVTWLDFRADDLSQARDFIRSLQEEGVIDELGFLALQGRFSDLLHPATTTLMRSARYFYFVVGLYRQLEREGIRTSQVGLLAQQRQDALASVLVEKESIGVIGREAGLNLRQFPSLIYWSALRKLEILTTKLSEHAYQEHFDDIRLQRRGYVDDDKTAQGAEGLHFWASNLPPATFLNPNGQVKTGESFKLTKAEAGDLYRRFTTIFKDSLLSHMLTERLVGIEWPWDVPKPASGLEAWLWHAKNLSLFVRGATLQYHAMVIEERARQGLQSAGDSVRSEFEAWWSAAKAPLTKWSTTEFATVPTVASAMRPGSKGDRWFIDSWRERCLAAPSAAALLEDPKAQEFIRAREFKIKPAKARLRYLERLKQWKRERVGGGIFQFSYRHQVGGRFVGEILDGLRSGQ